MSTWDTLRRNMNPGEIPIATGLVIMVAGIYGAWPSAAVAGSLVVLLGACGNMLLAHDGVRQDERDREIHSGLGPFE